MKNIHKIRENIYITSDEEIKDGDWYYDTNDFESLVPIYQRSQDLKFYSGCKKIILTTDKDLDGVQLIDDEFLEWFIKNPSCEKIEVEDNREMSNEFIELDTMPYKIIIPKEEPKQETTLEEVAEKESEYLADWEDKEMYKRGFKDGAKWQQERMYSEEEVIAFGEFIFKHSLLTHTRGVKSLFEQFKKK